MKIGLSLLKLDFVWRQPAEMSEIMMTRSASLAISSIIIALYAGECKAQSFYLKCEREKTCLGQASCVPQEGVRLFFVNAVNRSVFDYISGMSTYWKDLNSWSTSLREPVSTHPEKSYVRLQKGNNLINKDIAIYNPPGYSTAAKISFGDAYDWTSSFERERPHRFRYSYAIELTEMSYEKGQESINLEYGYCNIQK